MRIRLVTVCPKISQERQRTDSDRGDYQIECPAIEAGYRITMEEPQADRAAVRNALNEACPSVGWTWFLVNNEVVIDISPASAQSLKITTADDAVAKAKELLGHIITDPRP